MRIFVGNLSFSTTDEELRQAFAAYGEVGSATVIRDKFSERSKGFGFVEMPSDEEAKAAIAGLNRQTLNDKVMDVGEAHPPRERRPGGGGRGGHGGGGRGGHGGGGRGGRW